MGEHPRKRSLGKWEMDQLLREEGAPRFIRLPGTKRLSGENLRRMLEIYGDVYVKPVKGFGGEGISRLQMGGTGKGWILQGEKERRFGREEEMMDSLLSHYRQTPCIVQQTAPLDRYEDKPFDIRVHMQKETDASWVYAAEVVRVGKEGSVVSNGGKVLPLESVVTDEETQVTLRSQMKEVGVALCRLLEKHLRFLEVGFDLGLKDGREFWLLEVNTDDDRGGPSHDLFAALPDPRTYDEIRTRYARTAGMPDWLQEWFFRGE